MRRVSEYCLGRFHEAGRGVPRDPKRALEWYHEACDGGEPRSMERSQSPVAAR
jgi:TPR repeat protein